MPARQKAINLLPPSDFEASFWGKFLKWAVTAGRYIIIVTEMIVIFAFLSRFKLDRDMADLASTLEGQKNVLEAQLSTENEFRETQARLIAVDQLLNNQLDVPAQMDNLVKKIPGEVKLVSMAVRPTEINIQANTLSEGALGEMLARMTLEEEWNSVEVTEFSADNITGIKVVLVVRL